MATSIRSHLVKIGNSQGFRIPKPLLELCGIGKAVEVEISVHDHQIVIQPVRQKPRQDWEAQFAVMAAQGEDALLDDIEISTTAWDEEEWDW